MGVVEAQRQVGAGPVTVERRYYLSSLGLDAARCARAVRGHWSVENQCHWLLDMQMGEDQSRVRVVPASVLLFAFDATLLGLLAL